MWRLARLHELVGRYCNVLYSTRCLLCDVFARYGIRVAPVLSVERVFSQNFSIESIFLYSKTSIACGLRKAGVRGGAELDVGHYHLGITFRALSGLERARNRSATVA